MITLGGRLARGHTTARKQHNPSLSARQKSRAGCKNPTLSPRNLHDTPTRNAAMNLLKIYFIS
jgi:hypothetical protein